MNKLIGKIELIQTENTNGNDKKVITLRNKKEVCFVQFQGYYVNKLQGFNMDDNVVIEIKYRGKISKQGIRHNNIVGLNIERV
ncbi:hypothetical protein [Flavobacterium kingsejongi]|uniref:Uncharacterized protein n=1 Tax=Flavobacterium kingsejongi TaxID=1678728 RepID=A0A2S1LQL9_9FLAO|nr:hypothetical protein [Flavobacterium kingsejongi]AWG26019.1 hypothetical protein FK004_12685 [Flavobacterium kingsejongi]